MELLVDESYNMCVRMCVTVCVFLYSVHSLITVYIVYYSVKAINIET